MYYLHSLESDFTFLEYQRYETLEGTPFRRAFRFPDIVGTFTKDQQLQVKRSLSEKLKTSSPVK